MKKINVLDCTLRDGGWVNNFNFGRDNMNEIVHSIEGSGIKYIELGYLDKYAGSSLDRSCFADMDAVLKNGLFEHRNKDMDYFLMYDMGKYDPMELPERNENTVDGIRLCFHKEMIDKALIDAQIIKLKGYKLFLQPMVSTRYSDKEFIDMLMKFFEFVPGIDAVYIVDSFGAMNLDDVITRIIITNSVIKENVAIGVHTHNNMQLSFQIGLSICRINLNRELIVDGTLLGIGKGAGNLSTEVFLENLNRNYKENYNLSGIVDVIERVIRTIHAEYPWGYSIEYYLSAQYRVTPTYARYFYRECELSIDQVDELLSMIKEDKKNSFDKEYAKQLVSKHI